MLYAILLTLHSWWRWVVIVTAVVALVRAITGAATNGPWTESDRRWGRICVSALDLQTLVGLILLFVSPITTTAMHAMGEAMHDKTLRFFTVEHTTAMAIAVIAAHWGLVRAKKVAPGTLAHKRFATGLIIAAIAIAAGIPWPFLSYGRPLFRL